MAVHAQGERPWRYVTTLSLVCFVADTSSEKTGPVSTDTQPVPCAVWVRQAQCPLTHSLCPVQCGSETGPVSTDTQPVPCAVVGQRQAQCPLTHSLCPVQCGSETGPVSIDTQPVPCAVWVRDRPSVHRHTACALCSVGQRQAQCPLTHSLCLVQCGSETGPVSTDTQPVPCAVWVRDRPSVH
ncbi:hypothetical protein ACOMHN_002489 [Nucella lapillus]